MNKKILLSVLCLLIFVSGIVFANNFFSNEVEGTCTLKQNYLSSPYQANPNNFETKGELVIVTREVDS